MSTTNPVQQVLITKGNQAPLAAGNPISALAVDQVGVFNAHTGLSVGAASAVADCSEIFVAVGVNRTGAGGGATLEDINVSAGQLIQSPLVKAYTNRCYTAPQPKIIDIAGFVVKCETEYGIKFELRNGEIYTIHGFNQFVKTFFAKSSCCGDQCSPCADGDCNDIANQLVTQINLDQDKLLTASYFTSLIQATVTAGATADGNLTVTIGSTVYTVAVLNGDSATTVASKIAAAVNALSGTPYFGSNAAAVMSFYNRVSQNTPTGTFALTSAGGTGVTVGTIVANAKSAVTVANYAAFVAANPGVCLGIRVQTNPTAAYPFNGDIPLRYWYIRGTEAILSLVEGFSCNGSQVDVQDLIYGEGSGYDLKWEEYWSGGWNGKPGPYRTSALLGVQTSGFEYFAVPSTNYHQIALSYDVRSQSNFEKYDGNTRTLIGIPCGDTTTLTGLIAIFDHIFTQFAANAGNAALCDCTGDETTDEYASANNGIKAVTY